VSHIRCFIAAALPAPVQAHLGKLQQRLRNRGLTARWVRPAAMHLTVKFLGELSPDTFDRVAEVLQPPLQVPGPLRLKPRELGTFPPGKKARVVWLGLEGDVAPLARAALEVEARVQRCGIERERRPYHPHLTLGRATRLSGLGDVQSALEEESLCEAPVFEVRDLVLFESRLRAEGASHIPRLTVPLSDALYPG
jgi:2'-5' RNA ligase